MLHLKQIQHKIYKSIRDYKQSRQDYSHLVLSIMFSLAESLGQTLLSLMWLLIIAVYLAVTSILNLSWLIGLILKKLVEQLKSIQCRFGMPVYPMLGGRSEEYNPMYKKLLTSAWKKDGEQIRLKHIDTLIGNVRGT